MAVELIPPAWPHRWSPLSPGPWWGVLVSPPHPPLTPQLQGTGHLLEWVWMRIGGSHISWAVFGAWVPRRGTWTKRRSGHGLEQGACGPRTMGESAKGPAGVAGFLQEKSQNELLRGRLAPAVPYLPSKPLLNRNSFQGLGGAGEVKHRTAASPGGNVPTLPGPSALPARARGYPAGPWGGAEEEARAAKLWSTRCESHRGSQDWGPELHPRARSQDTRREADVKGEMGVGGSLDDWEMEGRGHRFLRGGGTDT